MLTVLTEQTRARAAAVNSPLGPPSHAWACHESIPLFWQIVGCYVHVILCSFNFNGHNKCTPWFSRLLSFFSLSWLSWNGHAVSFTLYHLRSCDWKKGMHLQIILVGDRTVLQSNSCQSHKKPTVLDFTLLLISTLPFKSLGSLRNVFIFQRKALFFQ